jgi:hypothetical protein
MAKAPTGSADFVAKIVKDPKNPPTTLMLTGYVGASSEDGHTRLYFDPNLSTYVEIPYDAVLHTQPAEGDGGLGASHVWIKRDAQVIHGPAATQRATGTFLDGPIMQAHMAGAAAAAGPAAFPPRPTIVATVCCWTPNCPSQPQVCVSQPLICNQTAVIVCATATCTTPPLCPHLSVAQCPSFGGCPSVVACPPTSPHAHRLPPAPRRLAHARQSRHARRSVRARRSRDVLRLEHVRRSRAVPWVRA